MHVDDILLICWLEDVPRLQQSLGATLKMKVDGPHLLAIGDQLMYLNKRITLKEDGVLIQSNATYIPKLTSLLKVTGRKKKHVCHIMLHWNHSVQTLPLTPRTWPMSRQQLSGLALYVAMDKPDVQPVVRTLSSYMSKPNIKAMAAWKHLAFYLDGSPDNGVLLRSMEGGKTICDLWNDDVLTSDETAVPDVRADNQFALESFSDSSWAHCKATRRNTNSGVIFLNGSFAMRVCRSQTSVALSSLARLSCTQPMGSLVESVYLYRFCKFLVGNGCEGNSEKVSQRLFLDSSPALGLIRATGTGRLKHIQIMQFFLQDLLRSANDVNDFQF